jgi:photosystem II stability/assembly factor-like uncharacterized protein
MKPKLLLCLALVLGGGMAGGCAIAHRRAVTVVPKADHYIGIRMLDARNGWARANGREGFRVLHTTDGAQTWEDVTPHPFTNKIRDCEFPKPQMAWLSFYDKKTCLLLTTNAGKTWAPWAPPEVHSNDTDHYFLVVRNCRFFDGNSGIAKVGNFAAGNAYYNFLETHDGGMTWKPADVIPRHPDPSPGVPPGTFHLCSMCGDGVSCYPPATFVVTYGDLPDAQPEGAVRLSLSANSGKSWRDLRLPLPDEYRDGLTEPSPPVFFNRGKGLLPVWVSKREADNSRRHSVLIFYATSDGGNTWMARPKTVRFKDSWFEKDLEVVSFQDIFLRSGADLYVTRDSAQSWQIIRPDTGPGFEGANRHVSQMDFVDARHGWLVTCDTSRISPYGNYSLYKTADGGKTWAQLPLKISQ